MGIGISDSSSFKFNKTGSETWTKISRGFTAVIVRTLAPTNYQLTINPGIIVSNHRTLRSAKNQFRKFLFDKPPL